MQKFAYATPMRSWLTTDSVTITQTATVTFTAGAVSASQSTVAANPTSVAANGSTTSTITVTLKDANSNPVSGKTVTLAQGAGHSTISAPSGASNGSGVVTFTVTDTTAEAVTYTATDSTDSITLTQTATVTFTNGNTISFNLPISVAVQPNSTTTYTFAGATGQVVNTELANWTGTITLSILDPTGAVVSSNWSTGNIVDLHGIALQSTGTFTIQIVSRSGTSGNGTLSLTSNTTGPTINFNTPVSVTMSSSADAEFAYTFSGTAGQVVNSEVTNWSSRLDFYLLGPSGSVLGYVTGSTSGEADVRGWPCPRAEPTPCLWCRGAAPPARRRCR